MTNEAQKIDEVKGLGIIYRIDAPLDEQLQAFEKVGIKTIATPEEIAQIRLAGISDSYSRTNIAPIAIKGGKTILFRNSPLMNHLMAVLAVNSHRKNEYFTLGKEIYEAAEAIAQAETGIEPEDRTANFVSQTEDFSLTPEMDEARFLLRKQNASYFDKFTEGTIHFYNFKGDFEEKATVNYLWFSCPPGVSFLDCDGRNLGRSSRAFGVLGDGAASVQKNGYSLTEIGKANSKNIPEVLKNAGVPAITDIVARELNKGLLDKLRRQ